MEDYFHFITPTDINSYIEIQTDRQQDTEMNDTQTERANSGWVRVKVKDI